MMPVKMISIIMLSSAQLSRPFNCSQIPLFYGLSGAEDSVLQLRLS